jgi:hypothetical protein
MLGQQTRHEDVTPRVVIGLLLLLSLCMQAFNEVEKAGEMSLKKEPSKQAHELVRYMPHEGQASRLKKLVLVISACLLLVLGLGLGLGFGLHKGGSGDDQSAQESLSNATTELSSTKAVVTTASSFPPPSPSPGTPGEVNNDISHTCPLIVPSWKELDIQI